MIKAIRQSIQLQFELNNNLSYHKLMIKRFTHYIACLLLVLLPLQGIAAANMSICNSLMQVQTNRMKQMQNMPCHKQMPNVTNEQDSCKHKSACKTNCATLCASLSGLTALPSDISLYLPMTLTTLLAYTQTYASITQPNLQRPPILLA